MNVVSLEERMKDYAGFRPAAIKLMGKIRKYWNDRGYQPELELQEGIDHNGKPLFSIRSDIWTNGKVKMNKFEQRKEKTDYD